MKPVLVYQWLLVTFTVDMQGITWSIGTKFWRFSLLIICLIVHFVWSFSLHTWFWPVLRILIKKLGCHVLCNALYWWGIFNYKTFLLKTLNSVEMQAGLRDTTKVPRILNETGWRSDLIWFKNTLKLFCISLQLCVFFSLWHLFVVVNSCVNWHFMEALIQEDWASIQ